MSAASGKAWIVAASIGAVEALKDQVGICRWNYTIRSLHQHAKNNLMRSFTQAQGKQISTSSSSSASIKACNNSKANKSEESLKKVMDLSCWGPSTVRF